MDSKGVIYIVAGGNLYLDEAKKSAESLKNKNPNLSTSLIADKKIDENAVFDNYIYMPNTYKSEKLFKINGFNKSPYDVTLFLDSDTYICSQLEDLFRLVEKYDLAIAHAPVRNVSSSITALNWYGDQNIPDSYPEFNTGVILFRKNQKTTNLFDRWNDIYLKYLSETNTNLPDQASFRDAIYGSNLLVSTLTPEYNCRYIFPTYVHGEIKILHCRKPMPHKIAKRYNKTNKPRVIIPGIGIIANNNKIIRLLTKILNSRIISGYSKHL